MKRIILGCTMLVAAMVSLTPRANAQKGAFTGTITFDVKATGNIPEQAKSMMPTEMIYKLTPDKQSITMKMGMMNQKTICDATKQEADMLMDIMGQKFDIHNNLAQLAESRKAEGEVTAVKNTTETKTIAGYKCTKAVVTMKMKDGSVNTMDLYFTPDIDISKFKFANTFPEINGFPMQFTMKTGPIALEMTARSIKKESIPASEFEIASDYKKVTQEELRNMFGGGGQ